MVGYFFGSRKKEQVEIIYFFHMRFHIFRSIYFFHMRFCHVEEKVRSFGMEFVFNTRTEVFTNADGKTVPVICDPDKMLEEALKAPFNYVKPFLNIPQEVLARILPFCHFPTETWKTLQCVCKELYVRINDGLSPAWLKWTKVKNRRGMDWSIAWSSARAFLFWTPEDNYPPRLFPTKPQRLIPRHPCYPLHQNDMLQIAMANDDAKLKKMTMFIMRHRRYLRNVRLCAREANESHFASISAEIFNDQCRVSHFYADLSEENGELATRTIQLALNCQHLKSLRINCGLHINCGLPSFLSLLHNAKATLSHLWFEWIDEREGGMEELLNVVQTNPSLVGIIVANLHPESKELYYKIRAQAKKNKAALELKK